MEFWEIQITNQNLKKNIKKCNLYSLPKKMANEEAQMKKTLKPLQRSKISEVGCIN
jgi:hypothetical protein